MPDAIVLKSLTKTFGEVVAVRDLDLVVPEGALYGVIGPNGAGKTTTIRMMLSILFPDRGEVSILGRASALEAKDRIGYLPEERGLYKKMRVRSFLTYVAALKGVADAGLEKRVDAWLERVDLAGARDKRCEELSKGMQQKVQVLAAMIHQPDLLVLDEPFSGLDPVNQRMLRDLVLEEHRRGATILFSTHIMVHAEQLCDHVVMIHRGEKVLDETMSGVRARFDPRSLLFEPLDAAADVTRLGALPGIEAVRKDGAAWEVALSEGTDPASAIRAVAAAVPPARVEIRRPTLEDVFVSIVSGGPRADEQERARLREAVRDQAASMEVRS
jgi:ABC-2 type transport system ATP-binding protein